MQYITNQKYVINRYVIKGILDEMEDQGIVIGTDLRDPNSVFNTKLRKSNYMIVEIQQSSNGTDRLYYYGKSDMDSLEELKEQFGTDLIDLAGNTIDAFY